VAGKTEVGTEIKDLVGFRSSRETTTEVVAL
jgi:hypothetical protein